ncbi:MAG TPA: 30S ribosome-binding factor RbfA [Candidatus Acidoferrales bacterium]|nr:30S ribosome-binding factor RbfA [Candidatus Acidoferrales bacterium]
MTIGGHGHRFERVAEEINHEVSLMLAGELKDPRLAGSVSVTEVRVSPDLGTVRVYVQIAGEPNERAATLDGLKAASGFIRHELVERLQLRRAPDVLFQPDESEEYGRHIDDLLRQARGPKQ